MRIGISVSLENIMMSGTDWNPNTAKYKGAENNYRDENEELISTRDLKNAN